MIEMSDADLLARLANCEDHMVERKTVADMNDSLKTVVAFANSAPIGYPCVLYIGVKDDGSFETRPQPQDFDSLQKKLNRMLEKTYPRVYYISKVITQGSNQALVVIVPGSPERPHFSGPSYVRRGSETFEASNAQLDSLIAMRSGKVYYLQQNVGKPVTVVNLSFLGNGTYIKGNRGNAPMIIDCNEFWLTLQAVGGPLESYSLRDVDLNFDNQRNRLLIEITTRQM